MINNLDIIIILIYFQKICAILKVNFKMLISLRRYKFLIKINNYFQQYLIDSAYQPCRNSL